MDEIYPNSGDIFLTPESRGKHSQREGLSEATPCKRTKVLLIVLCVSGVLAVLGLCVLGVLYLNKRADFASLNVQHETVLMQLKGNYSKMKDLQSSCQRLISSSCKPCEDGWTAYSGKCYFFSSKKHSWIESRDSCEALKSHLVTINTAAVNGFLASKIKETHWIGLNDVVTEGRWVWINNQTLEETRLQFWFKKASGDEPDDEGGEDCACLGYLDSHLNSWFDASCETQKKFICEKKDSLAFIDD